MPEPCAVHSEMLSAAVDREASTDERTELEGHLAHCPACREQYVRLTGLRRRTLVSTAPVLDDLVRRIGAGSASEVGQLGARRGATRRMIAVAAVVVVGLCLGAIFTAVDTGRPAADTAASVPGSGSVVTVKIMDQQVAMRHVTVRQGEVVRWVNTDLETHELSIDTNGARVDGDLPRRGVRSVTYNAPGTYRFDCALHPSVSGIVTVL